MHTWRRSESGAVSGSLWFVITLLFIVGICHPARAGDCNTNGVPDEQDVAGGTSLDCGTNGLPDECDVLPIGPTFRLSENSAGEAGDGYSYHPAISADGRRVAFYSDATNLVQEDTNGFIDVFLVDRASGQIENLHKGYDGTEANDDATATIDMTSDGRYISFVSRASNLVPDAPAGVRQVYVLDRETNSIEAVSVSAGGVFGDGSSYSPALSEDGRYVAFWSFATNLVLGDTNSRTDIFRHDRQTGETTRISVNAQGEQGNGHSGTSGSTLSLVGSHQVVMSADARYIAFGSDASNLVAIDVNNRRDVFVADTQTGLIELASISSTGEQGDGHSGGGAAGWHYAAAIDITADGRLVAFDSSATNLAENDLTNHVDIHIRDRVAGVTVQVPADGPSVQEPLVVAPAFSDSGRYLTFATNLEELAEGQTPGVFNVFRFDQYDGSLDLVSLDQSGTGGDDDSGTAGISVMAAGGGSVAFCSYADNLSSDAPAEFLQIFVRDMSADCNTSGVPDTCEIQTGDPADCNTDSIPDECEPDCNTNGLTDICEAAAGTSLDCDTSGVPDACEDDCNTNGVRDVCESDYADCNTNRVADACDVGFSSTGDCDTNVVPDECEPYFADDCNTNGLSDVCDEDCNSNDLVDPCEIQPSESELISYVQPQDVAILDGAMIMSDSLVSDVGAVSDVNVTIDIMHNHVGQLLLFLVRDATTVELSTLNGGTGNHYIATIFDQDAPTSITSGSPPFSGLFRPEGNLDMLVGSEKRGTWTLQVADSEQGSTGTLLEWTLAIENSTVPDCNSNGVPDACEPELSDCNTDGQFDICQDDCNTNDVVDACDEDCNTDGQADACQTDPDGFRSLSFDEPDDLPIFPQVINSSTIHVATPGEIIDLNVNVAISLNLWYYNALAYGITHEGTSVSLSSWNPASFDITSVLFDEDVGKVLVALPAAGTVNPDGNLDDFDGHSLMGDWTLDIDLNASATGTLLGWTISAFLAGPHDCNTNGNPDECDAALTDCDANGLPDDCDRDCNTNGWVDACETASGSAPDCNTDGAIDACGPVILGTTAYQSPSLTPIYGGVAHTFLVPSPPPAVGDVAISLEGIADLFFSDEFIDLRLNGVPIGSMFAQTGSNCNQMSNETLTVSPAIFKGLVAEGNAEFQMLPSNSVDGCLGGYMFLSVAYPALIATDDDCNTNSLPDSCDLADGAEPDCNTNSVVDVCDFDPAAFVYAIDDGTAEVSLPGGVAFDFIWLQAMTIAAGQEVIDEILVAFGDVPDGLPATVAVWSDPNNDGEPDDAVLLATATTVTADSNTGTFVAVPVPPAYVGAAGDVFFVGALMTCSADDAPAALDETPPSASVWYAGGPPGTGNLANLTENEFGPSEYSAPGNWLLRAAAITVSTDCNTNTNPDECDIDEGQTDCNTNGLPDLCDYPEGVPDCNTNGLADECDLETGLLADCNTDLLPDECEPSYTDCNTNGALDGCDPWVDCNANLVFDPCEIASGSALDDDQDQFLEVCDNCDGLANPEQAAWLLRTPEGGNAGQHARTRLDDSGRIMIAYVDPLQQGGSRLRLWFDANGNLGPDAGEFSTIDNTGSAGQYASMTADSAGRLVLAYYATNGGDLRVWFDADGDFKADAGEVSNIDSDGNVGQYTSVQLDSAGRAVVSYVDVTNGDLRLWFDADGDFGVDSGEKRAIDSGANVGYTSLAFDSNHLATIAYYDTTNDDLKLWHDDDGDLMGDAGDFHAIDTAGNVGTHTTLVFDAAGAAIVAYHKAGTGDLLLWRDADGDFAFDAGEIQTIDAAGTTGLYISAAFDPAGRLLISYYRLDLGNLKLWFDADGDVAADAGEIQNVQTAGDTGLFTSLVFHPTLYAPFIAYRDETKQSLMLTAHLDWDADTFCFADDNCPTISNADQSDSDGDGAGDACDPCPAAPGDVSLDGQVNVDDVGPFVSVLLDPASAPPEAICAADVNADGSADGLDIQPFAGLVIPP